MPEVLFPAGQTLADGYGKGVHGKPHRNEKQLNQTHILLPLSYQIRSLHCMSGQLPDRTGLPFCGSCAVMRQPSGRIGLPGQNWALLPSDSRPNGTADACGLLYHGAKRNGIIGHWDESSDRKNKYNSRHAAIIPHFQPSVKNSRESEKLMHNFAFLAFLFGRLVL